MRGATLKAWAMPSLFAVAGAVMACYPTLFSGFARIQNDPWDTRLLNYVLEHDYLWLVRAPLHRDLWTAPIFYPESNTAAYTELTVGMVPFYAPWRAVGFAPDTALQIWILVSLLLNFAAMYILLRRCLQFGTTAACFGSFLFSYGSPRLNQLNHQFLLPQFFTLFAVFSICRLFQAHEIGRNHRGCTAYLAILCGSVAAQIYASYYQGWFLAFALGIAVCFAIAIRSTREQLGSILRTHGWAAAFGLAGAVIAVAPLAVHYLGAARSVGFRQFWEAQGMLPRFQSWFYMGEENWIYGWTAGRGSFAYLPMEWEHRLGLGVATTAVVGWTLLRERGRPGVRILLGTWLVIALVASMYRWGFSPWKWIFQLVPGANGIRAVARIGLLTLIPAAIGLALFVQRHRQSSRKVAAIALSLFCLVEQGRRSLSYEKEPVRRAVSAISAGIDPRCEAFFCLCADRRSSDDCQLDAMWAGLEAKVPTVNGASGNNPPQFGALVENAVRTPADEARLRTGLDAWLLAHGRQASDVCWVKVPVEASSERSGH
jgi:hypothetical protein